MSRPLGLPGSPERTAEAFIRSLVRPESPLTCRQVGVTLGVHPNTVKRIPHEMLPYFRVGSRGDRRYEVEDVRMYITLRAMR